MLVAHAEGDETFAEKLAAPIRDAGYEVVHRGTLLVGESLMQEATRVLVAGGPVVLCGTIRAMGTLWAQHIVSAARAYNGVRIFGVQVERDANLRYLTFDAEVAAFWRDPERAMGELVAALMKHYPLDGPRTSVPANSDVAVEQRFRDLLLNGCDIIDLANLPTDRHLATRQLALRSLFVPLKVRVEREAGQEIDADELIALERRRADDSPPTDDSLPKAAPSPSRARERSLLAPVGLRLQQSRRLVILGDPGAGKTTLLRWIATGYLLRLRSDPDWSELPAVDTLPDEDWLPILIRCRDLGPDQVAGTLEDMLVHVLRRSELAATDVGVLREAVGRRLQAGTALLLIDGLDEIADPGARARFCRQLEQVHLAQPNAPIIATSRIVGYREMGYRIGRGFEHVTIAELDGSDKDDFIRRWCAVTEPPSRQQAVAAEIAADIHSTDRIERLTSSPLLLTTMALVKRKVGKLPERRADLYREAVQVLLNWRAEVDEPIDHHEAVPQLEYIAYAMSERGVQQLADDEMVALLGQMRAEYPNVHAVHRRPAVEFIRLLERRTGILVESGYVRQPGRLAPIFEFRHLTFQEYLAALALVEGRFPGRDRSNCLAENVGRLAARLGDNGGGEPAMTNSWQETTRLCVTICKDDDVDGVLRAVLIAGRGEGAAGTERLRAVLAARCLEDEPNVADSTVDEILDRLAVHLLPDNEGSDVVAAVLALARSRWAPRLHARLTQELRIGGERAVLHLGRLCGQAVAESAPQSDADRAVWQSAQIAALSSTSDDDVLRGALAIGYLASRGRPAVWHGAENRLLELIAADDPVLAGSAAWTLARMRETTDVPAWCPTDREVDRILAEMGRPGVDAARIVSLATAAGPDRRVATVAPLIAAAEDNDEHVRAIAVGLLGKTGREEAVAPLVSRLNDPEQKVRAKAATALGSLRSSNAIEALLGHLSHAAEEIRRAVAEALGSLGDTRAVTPLIAALDDEDAGVRGSAAWALGMLGDGRAVEPLVTRFDSFDPTYVWRVAYALGSLGDGRAVESLVTRFDDESDDPRWWVAFALDDLRDRRAYEALLSRLGDTSASVRGWVLRALGSLGDDRALDQVAAALADDEPEVRRQAANALAAFCDDRALAPLIAALGDTDVDVRSRAAAALGQFADTRIRGPLAAAFQDTDHRVRGEAATAIGRLRDERALELLVPALRDPHPYIRGKAARALRHLGDVRAVEPLINALADPVATVREEATYALGDLGDRRCLPTLRRLLADPDAVVRAAAAGEIGCIGDGRSFAAIVRGLDAAGPGERQWAAYALGQLADDRAISLLVARLDDPHPDVRLWAAEALGHLDSCLIQGPLLAHLTDPHPSVRKKIVEALGQAGEPSAAPQLLACLDDPHPGVRSSAAEALADIGATTVVEELVRCLDDPHPDVRGEASWALGALGDARAVTPLLACLDDPHPRVASATAWALGQLGDIDVAARLTELLDCSYAQVRRRVVEALAKLISENATPLLVRGLNDQHGEVREFSAWGLGRSSGEAAVEPLLARLGDPSTEVREEVAVALGKIKDRRAIAPLAAHLNDPFVRVRGRVAVALGRLGERSAIDALQRAVNDSHPWVSARAAWALGLLGEASGTEVLRTRLRFTSGEDRRTIVAVLSHLGDKHARRVLRRGLTASAAPTRRMSVSDVAWTLPDPIDRDLLSRDGDGSWPFIDPRVAIEGLRVERMARCLHLGEAEVRRRYAKLARVVPFTLA
ncbi:MAG TPA: HEAT repeat domain-containing protein [Micromonosporaceae bacterium]|nr:HEAT repeat domain-containing protein [Micromonosporaceae bacterium]